jgi:hypothetical protein
LHTHVYGDFAYVRGLAVMRNDDGKLPVRIALRIFLSIAMGAGSV